MRPRVALLFILLLTMLLRGEQVCFAEGKQISLPGWGVFIDPDGDCTAQALEEGLVIEVPGTLHNMTVLQNDPSKRYNAPRVMREIEGDFVARVKVTADFRPGPGIAGCQFSPTVFAGLLIWDAEDQLIRFGKGVTNHPERGLYCSLQPIYDVGKVRANKWEATTAAEYVEPRVVWVRIERKGQSILTALSGDGIKWHQTAVLQTILPPRITIGPVVVNATSQPFKAGFQMYQVGQD